MPRFTPNELILYVDDVAVSAQFYRRILGVAPTEEFDGFAVFPMAGGFDLGLQDKHDIEPAPQAAFGGFEICVADVDRAAVDALYGEWAGQGVPIVMAPTEDVFGYTFVATDPDGHRLRVCATDTTALA
jgi:predicted enzyme related to lactoylglutathione lyase